MEKNKQTVDISEFLQPQEEKSVDTAFYEVLKNMTDSKNAVMLTELSDNDLKAITRLEMLTKMRNQPLYKEVGEIFIKLRVSKDRKSRGEILTAIKNAHPEQQNPMGGSFGKMRQLIM